MIIADTDVLIDFLKGAQPHADRVELELKTGGFATTAVTVFELLSGARTERQRKAIESLLAAMTVLPFGVQEAQTATKLRLQLEAEGQTIGMADFMIASVCLERSSTLLTRNVKHFSRIPGLKISGRY
ncbi:MAG: type II toxin-antitoxin system VapC family toxin [Deltaproteobacteria bacterium]|nr:type II toxin-antitoxin system VapC family toxin [Deltaproteobacteria bacterium]